MSQKETEHTLFLYDSEDIKEFNSIDIDIKNIFLFNDKLKYKLKKKNINLFKFDINKEVEIQEKISLELKEVYNQFITNLENINNLTKYLKENTVNIFFLYSFSFLSILKSLDKDKKYSLIIDNKLKIFDDTKQFIITLAEKFYKKKNQGFFEYITQRRISFFKNFILKINLKLLIFFLSKNKVIFLSGTKLSKKIAKLNENKNIKVVEIKSCFDFKFYHFLINLVNLFILLKNKTFYFAPRLIHQNTLSDINFRSLLAGIKNNDLKIIEQLIINNLDIYSLKQLIFSKDIEHITSKLEANIFITDQLRFDISTIFADIFKNKNKRVVLVPHGSLSKPDSKISKFVNLICGRGLIYSPLSTDVISQSKISYNAIKYHDKNVNILKSKPMLFGDEHIFPFKEKKNMFTFLHASTPKSMSKWPWIYESYNEYLDNIEFLNNTLRKYQNVELIIRFREGPEFQYEDFERFLDLKKNHQIKLSNNKKFSDDLSISNCLISFSSTSIEEALINNKKVLIHSNYKKYHHINHEFTNEANIFYSDKNTLEKQIDEILKSKNKQYNYDIKWDGNYLEAGNNLDNLLKN